VKYNFLTPQLAENIAKNLYEWLGKIRIEFSLQGEPLLNPNALDIISIFRKTLPKGQLQLTTNGDFFFSAGQHGINFPKVAQLFDAGINIVLMDYYGNAGSYPVFFKELETFSSSAGISCYDFYADGISPWRYRAPNIKEIIVVDKITRHRSKTNRSINNQAGNAKPVFLEEYKDLVELPISSRCSNPFRELVVKYDGVVAGCCMDWQREMVMGASEGEDLREIWLCRQFQLFRKFLWEKQRLVVPCVRCDHKGQKVGLLLDPLPDMIDFGEELQELLLLQEKNSIYANKYAYKGWGC